MTMAIGLLIMTIAYDIYVKPKQINRKLRSKMAISFMSSLPKYRDCESDLTSREDEIGKIV